MNDDQLIRALRTLDRPAAPAPAFADALFAELLARRGSERRSRRAVHARWLVVAAALVLFAVAVALLGVGRQGEPGPLVPLRWSQVGPVDGARLRDLVAFEGGFVAVGGRVDADGLEDGTVILHSPDGAAWRPVELGERAPGEPAVETMHDVYLAADGSIVAVGRSSRGVDIGWRSTDGEAWTPVTIGATATVPLVAASPGRYLLISDMRAGEPSRGPWHSTDGLVWRAIQLPAVPDAPDATWNPVGVAVGEGGYLVVVCRLGPLVDGLVDVWSDDCRTMASPDATSWTVSAPLPARLAVAWYRGAWLGAHLAGDKASIQVVRSTDGVTWTPSSEITDRIGPRFAPDGTSGSAGVDRLVVAGDRVLLSTGPAYSRAFVSTDGARWQDINLPGTVVQGIAADGDRFVAVGNEPGQETGQLWLLGAERRGASGPSVPAATTPPLAATTTPTATVNPATVATPIAELPIVGRAVRTIPLEFGMVTRPAFIGQAWQPAKLLRWDSGTLEPLSDTTFGSVAGQLPPDGQSIARGRDGVWITLAAQHAVALVNPRTGKEVRRIMVDAAPYNLVEHGDDLWIADFEGDLVLRVDLATGKTLATIPVQKPTGITWGEGAVWATVHVGRHDEAESIEGNGGQLARIDPATNAVSALIDVGPRPYWVVTGFGSAWTGNATGGSVSRVDAATNAVTTIPVGADGAFAIEVVGGAVWVAAGPQYWSPGCDPATNPSGAVLHIDPATSRVDGRVDVPCGTGIVPDGDRLWVSAGDLDPVDSVLIDPAG